MTIITRIAEIALVAILIFAMIVLSPILIVLALVIRLRRRMIRRTFRRCNTITAVKIWHELHGAKPIDIDSDKFLTIWNVTLHFLYTPLHTYSGQQILTKELESFALGYFRANNSSYDAGSKRAFVKKNPKASKHLREGRETAILIATRALRTKAFFQRLAGQKQASEIYHSRLRPTKLPTPLNRNSKWWKIELYIARQYRNLKQRFTKPNVHRYNPKPRDVASAIPLFAAAFLVLGVLKVGLIGIVLGIDFQNYFSIGDYVSNSIDSFWALSISLVVAFALVFRRAARANSFIYSGSAEQSETRQVTVIMIFMFIVGLASVIFDLTQGLVVNSSSIWLLGLSVVGYLSWHVIPQYLSERSNTSTAVNAFLLATVYTVSDAVGYIGDVLQPDDGDKIIVYEVGEHVVYESTEWRLVALTSNYLILRRISDGEVHVHRAEEIKSISQTPT